MPRGKGAKCIDIPTKARISRAYQQNGGDKTRGAAAKTLRQFELKGTCAALKVKQIDQQVRDGTASCKRRRPSGRPVSPDESWEEPI